MMKGDEEWFIGTNADIIELIQEIWDRFPTEFEYVLELYQYVHKDEDVGSCKGKVEVEDH
jgi:hypothetical protein